MHTHLHEDAQKVYDLLLPEQNRTKNDYARTSMGRSVSPTSSEACQWCIIGGLYRSISAEEDLYLERRSVLALAVSKRIGGGLVQHWDEIVGGQEQILDALKEIATGF